MGKPVESPLGDITDKWFANRTIGFAKICGYTGDKNSLSSAIKFSERKFKIPYDQSVGGGIFRELIDLTPSNHHYIPVTEFDKSVNELALKLFEKGYDVRFQTTQAIPVFINEMVVRLLYSIRRLIGYYIFVPKKDRSWVLLWKS